MLSNEAAVWAGLQQLAHGRVQRVVLEEMSLSEQMVLVAGASTLIGVHGQALAWLPFLPWGRERVRRDRQRIVSERPSPRRPPLGDAAPRWRLDGHLG